MVLREAGLLVIALAAAAPVVLGCPDEDLGLADPALRSTAIVDAVHRRLTEKSAGVPGPMLIVPFDVLMIALSRDVDADAHDPDGALREIAAELGPDAAERYEIFLSDIAGSESMRAANGTWDRLLSIGSAEELRAAIATDPDIIGPEQRKRAQEIIAEAQAAGDPHGVRIGNAVVSLLDKCATGDVGGAWAGYATAVTRFAEENLTPQVSGLLDGVDEAVDREDFPAATRAGEDVIAKAKGLGMRPLQVEASVRTANIYFEHGDGAADLERCCELLEDVLELLANDPTLGDKRLRVQALLNLGAAVGGRGRGDPAANQERSVALTREVLRLVTIDEDGATWATAHTNLGLSLVERERVRIASAYDPIADHAIHRKREPLIEAIQHFEKALIWRSFERDPRDYAYTQANLALAYSRLGERGDLQRAIEHGSEAIRGFAAANDRKHVAQALGNRGNARLTLALLKDTSTKQRSMFLSDAEQDNREAIAAGGGEGASGLAAGRRWSQLARTLAAHRGYCDDTRAAFQRALDELTPETDPWGARDAGARLGALAAGVGDWRVAADAWQAAAHAGAAAVEARATRDGRLYETAENGTLFRWAAYALVRAEKPARAIEILELGRGRQLATWLRRDLVDLEPLRRLDRGLCARFLEARQRVEAAERTRATVESPDVGRSVEDLTRVIDEIRRLPGLTRFLKNPQLDELIAGLPVGETIAYPVTSPFGSAWLLVDGGVESSHVEVIELPELTSTSVMEAMLRVGTEEQRIEGYLLEQTFTGDGLDHEIAVMASGLGPELMRPLADSLAARATDTVTIVALSTLGQVPLHALTWDEAGAERCLLDSVAPTYAPSGYIRQIAVERAEGRGRFERLLAVGNALPQTAPLPGSESEVTAIAAVVPAVHTTLLVGTDASKEAVVDAVAGATHVHLACHGSAVRDLRVLDGGLSFAHDEMLSGAELLDLDLRAGRLVVASACETGLIADYATADESLSVSTLLLAAGATGVIASLWQVDDYATSLLMTRMYEELVAKPDAPARALRAAQLWLRDLDQEGEQAFALGHPALRTSREAWMERRNGKAHACGAGSHTSAATRGGTAGFGASPTLWAAFVFSGA
jgi:CHAT domain-containing protein/tetratricopeptide (TPR) repeat protein